VAFADVAAKLTSARTLSYRSTVTLPGKPPLETRVLFASTGRIRTESPDGAVSISDGKRSLILNPREKTATRLDFSRELPQVNFAEGFRKLGSSKGEPIGEKKIDGVQTRGFRATVGNVPMTIWADAKSALPVRVESTFSTGQGEALVVMDEFQFDPPVDESLLSLDVPQGYALVTHKLELPASLTPESMVADFLRTYTEFSGGSFPPRLDDPDSLRQVMAKITDPAKQITFTTKMGMLFGTIFALRDNYGYAGKDVKLGEKDKIVFWYKRPTTEKYGAVFGDLHTGDVEAKQLPATQPTTQQAK